MSESPADTPTIDQGAEKESLLELDRLIAVRTRFAERRWRLRIVAALTPACVLVLLLVLRATVPYDELRGYAYGFPRPVVQLFQPTQFLAVITVLGFLTLGGTVMLYLQTGFRRENDPVFRRLASFTASASATTAAPSPPDANELWRRLQLLEERISVLPTRMRWGRADVMTPEDRRRLVDETARRVQQQAGAKIINKLRESLRRKSVDEDIDAVLERLARELDALSFRGNLNLTLGVLITLAGIGFLVYFVLFKQVPIDPKANPLWFLVQFLPRLTLVILIEVFAYFFLRLYKSSLAEIKYFQNEMTNFEAKAIALRAATISSDRDTAASILRKLSDTERNLLPSSGSHRTGVEEAEQSPHPETTTTSKEVVAILQRAVDLAKQARTRSE